MKLITILQLLKLIYLSFINNVAMCFLDVAEKIRNQYQTATEKCTPNAKTTTNLSRHISWWFPKILGSRVIPGVHLNHVPVNRQSHLPSTIQPHTSSTIHTNLLNHQTKLLNEPPPNTSAVT